MTKKSDVEAEQREANAYALAEAVDALLVPPGDPQYVKVVLPSGPLVVRLTAYV